LSSVNRDVPGESYAAILDEINRPRRIWAVCGALALGPGPLAEGDKGEVIGPAEGGAVQEAQGTNGLVERAPRHAALEQVQLVGANVVRTEHLRRAAEVPGKGGDLADVGVDGAACVVAQAQVVDEALSKRGHGASPRGEKENAQGEP
jgi:hypothetical protein